MQDSSVLSLNSSIDSLSEPHAVQFKVCNASGDTSYIAIVPLRYIVQSQNGENAWYIQARHLCAAVREHLATRSKSLRSYRDHGEEIDVAIYYTDTQRYRTHPAEFNERGFLNADAFVNVEDVIRVNVAIAVLPPLDVPHTLGTYNNNVFVLQDGTSFTSSRAHSRKLPSVLTIEIVNDPKTHGQEKKCVYDVPLAAFF
jgi:hypothetical protein